MKEEILKKWDSGSQVIKGEVGPMGMSEEKKEWMSQYAELHTTNEIVTTPDSIIISQPGYGSLLPIVMKVAAQTIGQDLVSVHPMGGEMNKINQEVIIENRDRKIDALVEGKEFNEMKPEDHPDYKKSKGPSAQLFYMDFVYGSTNSTTI